ncbi:Multidrug resistance protein 2 [Cytospora mali]|uniref:Multidrug resistance protein 2 n=1 Tax=Cytospora mali TaxID=578113 RepID=A0A194VPI9_CYTMA|nr:Multidrug resistance protein 2 [Valsa mali]
MKAEFEHYLDYQVLLMLILFIVRFTLSYMSKFSFRLIGIRISAAIRLHYLSSLLNQTVHVLDSMAPGAAAGTITSTANTLQVGISEKLGTFLEAITCVIAAVIVAFTYSWRVTLVTASVVVFISATVGTFIPFIVKGTNRSTRAETRAAAVATESFAAIRMVYAYGAQGRMAKMYAKWVDEAKKHGVYTSPFIALNFGCVFFGLYGSFGLSFWYGTKASSEGLIDGVGTIVVVLLSVFLMTMSLERMTSPLMDASKATVAAASFFAVIDAPQSQRGSLKDPDVTADGDIVFEGVTFAYPGRPCAKVLDDVGLTIKAGKTTAIVGPSGSGKSTIVGLVEQWYTLHSQAIIHKAIQKAVRKKKETKRDDQPEATVGEGGKSSLWTRLKAQQRQGRESEAYGEDQDVTETPTELENGEPVKLSGRIMTSGRNLDDIDVKWWRSQIGLVQQEPFLFNDSIYANVIHGLVGTQWEDEPLEIKKELARQACKEAFADEFINRLPEGYETQVGDSGLKLSGGQRQRLAIARSIVKKPKILILDEATSAIDVRGEKIIQAALDRVSQGRTTIMIAHRLSTIAKADNILVLQNGKLMEQGSHESLLDNQEGVYSGLVRAQRLTLGKEEWEAGRSLVSTVVEEEEDKHAFLGKDISTSQAPISGDEMTKAWKNKGVIGSFGRLLYEQRSRYPFYIIIVLSAAGVASALPVQAYLFAQVINVFTLPPDDFLSRSAFWSLMWLILALAVGFFYIIMGFFTVNLEYFTCATSREQYFSALIRQKIDFFDDKDHSVGTLTSMVQGDPKQLGELLGLNMGMVICSVFQLTGTLTIAFIFGWKLALVTLCVTVPIGLACAWYRLKYEMEFVKMSTAVFEESSKWAAEAIGAFRCVSSLTLEDIIIRRYQQLLHEHTMAAYRKARWTSVVIALSDSLSMACQALIFWYGGQLLASREYGILQFFVCYQAATQGAEAAGVGFSFGPNAAQATAAANRILSVRESRGEQPKEQKQPVEDSGMIPDSDGGVRIELRDVAFKYPTRNVPVFDHLNITVEKGQVAALVGASGSGKSSIVALLERFYDIQEGSIMCNGRDIRSVGVHEYRKMFSLVAQEATLFQGTIRENILLGVPESLAITESQLHQACRDAAIHDFIVSLPEGYNTNVGSRGVALSGGQKQRLSIARAIVRDPKVLLLDEATSSLDSESEKQITSALQKVAKGRTTLAVAHRLSTIQHADVIYVLGEGKVLEVGNHAELLRQRGIYYTMCQSQALDR